MRGSAASSAPSQPDELGARHLQEVLNSECFKRAASLRALLVYLWDNRHNDISEYAIAVEALGRSSSFESRFDASVRVQISRLRQFLTKYYESEGRHATERLAIPMGTHRVQVVEAEPSADEDAPQGASSIHQVLPGEHPAAVPGLRSHRAFLVPLLSAIIIGLLACVAGLLWFSIHSRTRTVAVARLDLPPFWKSFLDNGRPTRIVLPTPVFFSWGPPEHSRHLMARDVTVNNFDRPDKSSEISALEKKLGKPKQWRNYTVASDTFASLRLARFFDHYGVQTSISSSLDSPRGMLDHENIIVFGTPSSLADFRSDVARLSFQLGPYPFERYVIDKSLPSGSPVEFPAVEESASRTVAPGIVALLPHGSAGGRILIVQGIQTMALISYLISDEGMHEITHAQEQHGNCHYFEAVILSEVNAGNPIQSRMVAFRAFTGSGEQTSNQVADASLLPDSYNQDFFIGSASR